MRRGMSRAGLVGLGFTLALVSTISAAALVGRASVSAAAPAVSRSGGGCAPKDHVDVTLRLRNSTNPPHVELRVGQELRVVVDPYHQGSVSRPRAGSGRAAVCLISWRYRKDGGAVAYFRARQPAKSVWFHSGLRDPTPGASDPVIGGSATIKP